MPIQFTCPHCGKQTIVADQYSGQQGPCSGCGRQITVPVITSPAAPADSKPTSSVTVLLVVLPVVLLGALVVVGVLAALVTPVFRTAGRPTVRSQSANNLKQIGIAFHNYHDVFKSFPPAYLADDEGQPMHSWRVLILPFIEQQPLYDTYNFEAPWDHPDNQLVKKEFVPVYRSPLATGPLTSTTYVAVTGAGTVFDKDKACRMADIRDGTSFTVLAIEVNRSGIQWAEPRDMDTSQILKALDQGRLGDGQGANLLMCDGSVRYLSNAEIRLKLEKLATRSDGQAIDLP